MSYQVSFQPTLSLLSALPRRALAEAPAGAVLQVLFLTAQNALTFDGTQMYLPHSASAISTIFDDSPLVNSLPKPYPQDHVCNFSMICRTLTLCTSAA